MVSEALLFCFLFALVTGGFLAYHFTPGDHQVVYDGAYEPLRGVGMSAAYESTLRLGFEVENGLLMRQLHNKSLAVLVLGTVVWAVLARHRYAFAALGLCLVGGLSGYVAVDDMFSGVISGGVWSYVLHLLVALGMGAVLVIASRREAAREPRTPALVATACCLALLLIWL
ncbi:hypothetical protein [Nonomuraea sp. NPDC048826]|uniref:hypothetical protein n=1 Tax=Nonomuraea sp. NPDC048826 TaxID=3364347 RepID=UPI00371FC012